MTLNKFPLLLLELLEFLLINPLFAQLKPCMHQIYALNNFVDRMGNGICLTWRRAKSQNLHRVVKTETCHHTVRESSDYTPSILYVRDIQAPWRPPISTDFILYHFLYKAPLSLENKLISAGDHGLATRI